MTNTPSEMKSEENSLYVSMSAKPPSEMKLEEDPAVEWKFFLQKFKIFIQATKAESESEEYKAALLLNCIEKFEAYFIPSVNVTYERYIFFTRDMEESETVDEYVTQLKQLSKNCEFEKLTDSLIKDRLVLGIKDKNVKDRLLRTKNLDLIKAVEICKSAEITNKQLEILCSNPGPSIRKREDNQELMEVRRKNFHMGMKKQAPNTRRQNEVSNGQGQQHPRSRQRKQISFKSFNTKGYGRPIIGKTSIEDLDIARMVAEMSDTKRYMLDIHDVFDGIGCLPGQYRIKVDETVKPCIHAARRFPQGILVPESLRREMLNLIHLSHMGIVKCNLKAKELLYWPNMFRDIENVVLSCDICQKYSRNNFKESLIPHPIPEYPWQKVGCDLFEIDGKKYMIVIDYFSKYVEICKLNSISSEIVIKNLKCIFSRLGIPQIFMSDNGTQFSSFEFQSFAKSWQFENITSSPNYPRSNGMVERAIQTVKNIIKKNSESDTELELALLDYRNTPIDVSIPSPSELFFNRKTRTILPVKKELLYHRNINFKRQRNLLVKRQNKQKTYHDRMSKTYYYNFK
ncbi:uncharacterized protein LOC123322548 [Coccinella septempunctata]|uniref:uncharacterized protein LOC123322548 n=1 Tax=Coccinella septempunctata TaxID=41139 RepID=UPI001D079F5A|nr:uncharacterized protein LOC123322548 [Coccinella septempunctata]